MDAALSMETANAMMVGLANSAMNLFVLRQSALNMEYAKMVNVSVCQAGLVNDVKNILTS